MNPAGGLTGHLTGQMQRFGGTESSMVPMSQRGAHNQRIRKMLEFVVADRSVS